MRRVAVGLLGLSLAATSSIAWGTPANALQSAMVPSAVPSAGEVSHAADDLPNPQEDKRRALREEAIQDVISGQSTPVQRDGSTVVKVGRTAGGGCANAAGQPRKDQYVELGREKTDKIFVILAEFGNERHPSYPDQDTDPDHPGPGPLRRPAAQRDPRARPHGGQPDRSGSRTTTARTTSSCTSARGAGDESLKQYYERQSSGRYSVDGTVTDWVKVQYNEARYGRSQRLPVRQQRLQQHLGADPRRASTSGSPTSRPPGAPTRRSPPTWPRFDQWDRYDYDDDGNFNEPDGYIDHFQIVHAGGDQADGDP